MGISTGTAGRRSWRMLRGFDEECADCRYLYLCKTGCPFVKRAYASKKSYTCRLQQELYKFWGLIPSGFNDDDVYDYLRNVHPE